MPPCIPTLCGCVLCERSTQTARKKHKQKAKEQYMLWRKRSSAWASLIEPGRHSAITLDRPLTPFEVCCGLLVPLYVGRALEEAYFGKDARTLMTSDEVSS